MDLQKGLFGGVPGIRGLHDVVPFATTFQRRERYICCCLGTLFSRCFSAFFPFWPFNALFRPNLGHFRSQMLLNMLFCTCRVLHFCFGMCHFVSVFKGVTGTSEKEAEKQCSKKGCF